jgi:hypothetical protein
MAEGRYDGAAPVYTTESVRQTRAKPTDSTERVDGRRKGTQPTFRIRRERPRNGKKGVKVCPKKRMKLHRKTETAFDKHCENAIQTFRDQNKKTKGDPTTLGIFERRMRAQGWDKAFRDDNCITPYLGLPDPRLSTVFYFPISPPPGQQNGPGFKAGIPWGEFYKAIPMKHTPRQPSWPTSKYWAILKKPPRFALRLDGRVDKRFSKYVAFPSNFCFTVPHE